MSSARSRRFKMMRADDPLMGDKMAVKDNVLQARANRKKVEEARVAAEKAKMDAIAKVEKAVEAPKKRGRPKKENIDE